MADQEDVYCTLVMNDAYLPGAAVLAHSLRDCGTPKKLACLIVQDGLRADSIEELQSLYNYVIPVERIGNPHPGNLYLMNRPDLLYTFTKINLWRQVQFRKIVYIDADVVALRAPEELFDLPDAFAAAPDVGWPDAFNTGVMVISPNIGEYFALRGLAQAGDSFDGADQGLLNQYFEHRPWKRLSFTYNTTPSANYQYEPAYRYWKQKITLVHFIGREKPWQRSREERGAPSAFQEMLSRWWAVYDRHFHVSAMDYTYGRRNPVSSHVQQHGAEQTSESYYATGYPAATTQPAPPPRDESQRAAGSATPLMTDPGEPAENIDQGRQEPAPTVEQRRFVAPSMEWDATRGAPPPDARPEAANFPTQTYEFNNDPAPFRPPQSYPEPPRDMYYQVPEPVAPRKEEALPPIFPWEQHVRPKPTRRFIEDEPPPTPPAVEPKDPYADELEVTAWDPATPTIKINDDHWTAFAQSKNAWDEVNGINDYVRALTKFQKNRGHVQVVQQNVPTTLGGQPDPVQQHILSPSNEPDPVALVEAVKERRESLILTDFPTADDRPSLPVTPAPRRRSTFWGNEGRDDEAELPPAEGVPDQADWDPNASLEQLRKNSLIGPGDLVLPDKKVPRREMPTTAVQISESTLSQPHVALTKNEEFSDTSTSQHFSSSSSSSIQQTRFEEGTSSPEGPRTTSSFFHGSNEKTTDAVTSILSGSSGSQISQLEVNTAINAASGPENLPGGFSTGQSDEDGSFFGGGGSSHFTNPIFDKPRPRLDDLETEGKDFPPDDALSPRTTRPTVRFDDGPVEGLGKTQ